MRPKRLFCSPLLRLLLSRAPTDGNATVPLLCGYRNKGCLWPFKIYCGRFKLLFRLLILLLLIFPLGIMVKYCSTSRNPIKITPFYCNLMAKVIPSRGSWFIVYSSSRRCGGNQSVNFTEDPTFPKVLWRYHDREDYGPSARSWKKTQPQTVPATWAPLLSGSALRKKAPPSGYEEFSH